MARKLTLKLTQRSVGMGTFNHLTTLIVDDDVFFAHVKRVLILLKGDNPCLHWEAWDGELLVSDSNQPFRDRREGRN